MSILGPFAGFGVTFRQMFKPKVTTQYPEVKRVKPQRFHGRHVLNRYPDGMEKCIGCELCAGVCPARCIYVRGKENPPDEPISPGERYGFVYEINMLRCIFCALCVEACPTEAITMSHLFEMSVDNRDDAIYTRDELLMDEDGVVPHPQPDSILFDRGELQVAEGWARATAPSGRADYEGRIAWTPTAGIGLPPPEAGQNPNPEEGWEIQKPEPEHTDPEPTRLERLMPPPIRKRAMARRLKRSEKRSTEAAPRVDSASASEVETPSVSGLRPLPPPAKGEEPGATAGIEASRAEGDEPGGGDG